MSEARSQILFVSCRKAAGQREDSQGKGAILGGQPGDLTLRRIRLPFPGVGLN